MFLIKIKNILLKWLSFIKLEMYKWLQNVNPISKVMDINEKQKENERGYTLVKFKSLCDDLLCLNPAQDSDKLIEALRMITEMLIWNDQNTLQKDFELQPNDYDKPNFFEYFLERNLHIYMCWVLGLGIIGNFNDTIFSCYTFSASFQMDKNELNPNLINLKIQVLQSLNILFESIKNNKIVYYLFSNNFINQLVLKLNFNLNELEELLPYFITLLKALSFKLNLLPNVIPFFYNSQISDLPIYKEAIKYFDHHDSMVRVAVRTITLNVVSVKNEDITNALLQPELKHYFIKVIDKMMELPNLMDKALSKKVDINKVEDLNRARSYMSKHQFQSHLVEFLETLDYISDLVRLAGKQLKIYLRQIIFERIYLKIFNNINNLKKSLQLFLIIQLIFNINDSILLNLFSFLLFDLNLFNLDSLCSSPNSINTVTPNSVIRQSSSDSINLDNLDNLTNTFETCEERKQFHNIINQGKQDFINKNNVFKDTLFNTILNELDHLPNNLIRRNSSKSSISLGSTNSRDLNINNNISEHYLELSFLNLKINEYETNIILYLLLSNILKNKKEDFKLDWIISLGLCPVRYLRKKYLMKSLTSTKSVMSMDQEQGFNLIKQMLTYEGIESPSLSNNSSPHLLPINNTNNENDKIEVWYHKKMIYSIWKIITKHSRFHFITIKMAAELLLNLCYFPGTQACIHYKLKLKLMNELNEIKFKLSKYLNQANFPIGLIYFEFDKFNNNLEHLPRKLMGLDGVLLFTAGLDPNEYLNNKIAYLSRIIQMYLIYQKLNYWLLRDNLAIPKIHKQFKQNELNNQYLSDHSFSLNEYLALPIKVIDGLDTNLDCAILLKDNQSHFLLAKIDRRTFNKAKELKLVLSFNFYEIEFNTNSKYPQQIEVIKYQYKDEKCGISNLFNTTDGFPNLYNEFKLTLEFLDVMECLHALHNLNLAKKNSLPIHKQFIKSCLQL